LGRERKHEKEKRCYTVGLMTDGINNRGLAREEFFDWYRGEGEDVLGRSIVAGL